MNELQNSLAEYKSKINIYFTERKFSNLRYRRKILDVMPGQTEFDLNKNAIPISEAAPELKILYHYPLLNKEQEYHLFRKFNYFKYMASNILKKLNKNNVTKRKLNQVENWHKKASEVKHLIAMCNTRLVASWAKKQYEYISQPSNDLLSIIISDGCVGMTRAIDYFNFTLNIKFSTYASWAILDMIQRGKKQRNKNSDRQQTGCDDVLNKHIDHRPEPGLDFSDLDLVTKLIAQLEPLKKEVIQRCFGLIDGNPQNYVNIGLILGVSREQVRKIRDAGLADLRNLAGI